MTYKEIEKEFDKEFVSKSPTFPFDRFWKQENSEELREHRDFVIKIANQVIDEMIGEEKDELQLDKEKEHKEKGTMLHGFVSEMKTIQGYNQKVQELKEFKKKFNE